MNFKGQLKHFKFLFERGGVFFKASGIWKCSNYLMWSFKFIVKDIVDMAGCHCINVAMLEVRNQIEWCERFRYWAVTYYSCFYLKPTRDTLIVQLTAVREHHTRQLRFRLHHRWPQINSLYHLIAVYAAFTSAFYSMAAGTFAILAVVIQFVWPGPLPVSPRESTQCPCSI